jgi:hypothetical protein
MHVFTAFPARTTSNKFLKAPTPPPVLAAARGRVRYSLRTWALHGAAVVVGPPRRAVDVDVVGRVAQRIRLHPVCHRVRVNEPDAPDVGAVRNPRPADLVVRLRRNLAGAPAATTHRAWYGGVGHVL